MELMNSETEYRLREREEEKECLKARLDQILETKKEEEEIKHLDQDVERRNMKLREFYDEVKAAEKEELLEQCREMQRRLKEMEKKYIEQEKSNEEMQFALQQLQAKHQESQDEVQQRNTDTDEETKVQEEKHGEANEKHAEEHNRLEFEERYRKLQDQNADIISIINNLTVQNNDLQERCLKQKQKRCFLLRFFQKDSASPPDQPGGK